MKNCQNLSKGLHEGENVKSAPRSGRPKALDELEQNKLKVLVKSNNCMSANMIQKKFAEEN
nr:4129_t:CDS:2 [Entrophospora candida]